MAYITAADWSLRHPAVYNAADLGASSWPTNTVFAEWLEWASGKVNTHIHATSDVDDSGVTIKNIVDDLLWRRYIYERILLNQDLSGMAELREPELTIPQRQQLTQMYANKTKKPTARGYSLLTGRRFT
jgi:hypothetical protein